LARLGNTYRKVRDTVRYEGFGILLWKTLQRATNRFWQIEAEIWFAKDLSRPLPEVTARCDIEITEASEFDVPQLVAVQLEPYRSVAPSILAEETRIRNKVYRDDIRRGEKVFVATVGPDIVHVNWTHYVMHCSSFGHPILLDGSTVVTTDGSTSPRWRGLGIHAAVLNHMLKSAQQSGRTVAYTMTMLYNKRPRKGLRKLGWGICGVLLHCRSRRHEKIYSVWYGTRRIPLPPLREEDPRRLWRRSFGLGQDRCIMLATFRAVKR
jgi:hypothetical protein